MRCGLFGEDPGVCGMHALSLVSSSLPQDTWDSPQALWLGFRNDPSFSWLGARSRQEDSESNTLYEWPFQSLHNGRKLEHLPIWSENWVPTGAGKQEGHRVKSNRVGRWKAALENCRTRCRCSWQVSKLL